LIATPVTLVALLKAVAYGWRREKLAQSAREISNLGKQVYERASVLWDHLESLRGALTAAVNAFNKAVGSFETRLLPGIRRFRDLGATAAEPIPPLDVVEPTPRMLGTPPEAGKADGESEKPGVRIHSAFRDVQARNPARTRRNLLVSVANAKSAQDNHTLEELLNIIEAKGKEVAEALKSLREYAASRSSAGKEP